MNGRGSERVLRLAPAGFGRGGVALEVDEEAGDVGGGDAFEAGGLADGGGAEAFEPVAGFGAQGAEVAVGQVGRNPVVFHRGGASDLGFLLADVAGVLDLELNVGGGFGRGRLVARQFGNEIAGHAGADQHFQTGRGLPQRRQFELAQPLIDRGRCWDAQAFQPVLGGFGPFALAPQAGEASV